MMQKGLRGKRRGECSERKIRNTEMIRKKNNNLEINADIRRRKKGKSERQGKKKKKVWGKKLIKGRSEKKSCKSRSARDHRGSRMIKERGREIRKKDQRKTGKQIKKKK